VTVPRAPESPSIADNIITVLPGGASSGNVTVNGELINDGGSLTSLIAIFIRITRVP